MSNSRRVEFHELLCDLLGCATTGSTCYCYFQPPESIKMTYPAIVYILDDVNNTFADDSVYASRRKYQVTLITKNPDDSCIDALAAFATSRFVRYTTQDNLNHYVYEIYY